MNFAISHIIAFLIGTATGVLGNYWAARLIEKAKGKDLKKKAKNKYEQIRNQMPKLIDEITKDLKNPEMQGCREFIISPGKKKAVYNIRQPIFYYYEDEHPHLISKIRILENEEYVFDISKGKTTKYQFSEDFVKLLAEHNN